MDLKIKIRTTNRFSQRYFFHMLSPQLFPAAEPHSKHTCLISSLPLSEPQQNKHIAERAQHVLPSSSLKGNRTQKKDHNTGEQLLSISKLEEVNEMLRRHRHEAGVWVTGCAGVSRILPKQNTTVPTEMQGVSILFLFWVVFL